MNDWYYAIGQDRYGPVAESEVKALIAAGTLRSDSLVWRAGMAEWTPLGGVDVFASDLHAWGGGTATPPAGEPLQAPVADSQLPPSASAPDTSSFNPYAPPTTDAPLAAPSGEPLEIVDPRPRLDIEYCLARAWRLTLRHFGLIVGVVLLSWVISGIFSVLCDLAFGVSSWTETGQPGPGWQGRLAISQLLQQLLGIYLGLGIVRLGLNIAGGEKASVGDLFSQGSVFWRGVGATFLYYLLVVVGLIALIVPGIYLAIRFGYFQVALVDRNLGVFESFEYSSRLTKGNKWRLFLLGLLVVLIMFAGLLALVIGLLWAMPTAWLAYWLVAYRFLHRGTKDPD